MTVTLRYYALLLTYDGSCYHGFQRQTSDVATIQGCLEAALQRFCGEDIRITAAGRTDTGVHASYQVVSFATSAVRSDYAFVRALNAWLPPSIAVKSCTQVSHAFNARYDAISRTYEYYLLLTPTRPSIWQRHIGFYCGDLDIGAMQQAAAMLVGKHDFSSFRAADCGAVSPIRYMYATTVSISDNSLLPMLQQQLLCLRFTANGFLYHMIRNIVAALVYVGSGKITLTEFAAVFAAKTRRLAPPTFMPNGLYLTHVAYPINLFDGR
jgi:tRNA pseudouridine38-40 synthase